MNDGATREVPIPNAESRSGDSERTLRSLGAQLRKSRATRTARYRLGLISGNTRIIPAAVRLSLRRLGPQDRLAFSLAGRQVRETGCALGLVPRSPDGHRPGHSRASAPADNSKRAGGRSLRRPCRALWLRRALSPLRLAAQRAWGPRSGRTGRPRRSVALLSGAAAERG